VLPAAAAARRLLAGVLSSCPPESRPQSGVMAWTVSLSGEVLGTTRRAEEWAI
jgi:hypothetical protein